MTLTRATRIRVIDAIPIGGAPLRLISETSGVHISNVRTVVGHLADEGRIHTFRAGTGLGGKHELWCFHTAPARDCFAAEWAETVAAKQRERDALRTEQRRQERAGKPRNRRAEAAERREAERARKRVQAEEAQRAERNRLANAQQKLRAITKAAGAMPMPSRPVIEAPRVQTAPAAGPVVIPPGVKFTRLPSPPARFHVETVSGGFSSLPPGVYALPATSCAAKAAERTKA